MPQKPNESSTIIQENIVLNSTNFTVSCMSNIISIPRYRIIKKCNASVFFIVLIVDNTGFIDYTPSYYTYYTYRHSSYCLKLMLTYQYMQSIRDIS